MLNFIGRALQKLSKLTPEQVIQVVHVLVDEYDKLVSVLGSINQGVIICDIDMNITQCNKVAERFLPIKNYTSGEQKVWTVIEDDDISLFVKQSLQNQETINDKEFCLEINSQQKIVSISIFPLVQEKTVTGTLIIIEDITEKKTKESQLHRAENLASLTNLAAGVAHEIKNPLGSISIHIQLIQKNLKLIKGSGKANIEKFLDVINEEIDRLNKIVVDFLFAVRPINVELEDGQINDVINFLADFLKYEIDASKIDFKLDLADKLPLIKLDDRLLKPAFLNFIKNALEAMPKGGNLEIKSYEKNDMVYVEFKDTGNGISPERVSKIFEPYYTTKIKGSGLGLTLTYKIIKEHGGDIQVHSFEKQGTTFKVSLPIPQSETRLLNYSVDDLKEEHKQENLDENTLKINHSN